MPGLVPVPVDSDALRGVADIIFCIDVSGSMKPCIDGIINNLKIFFDSIETGGGAAEGQGGNSIEWRGKVYYYSDLEADKGKPEYAMNTSNSWVENADDLKVQFDAILHIPEKERLGGDEEESTFDAIYIASKQGFERGWQEVTRCVIVFSDAPPKKLHNDTYNGGLENIEILTQTINDGHIKLFLFTPNHTTYSDLSKKANNVKYNIVESGKGLKQEDFNEIMDTLGKTITKMSVVLT